MNQNRNQLPGPTVCRECAVVGQRWCKVVQGWPNAVLGSGSWYRHYGHIAAGLRQHTGRQPGSQASRRPANDVGNGLDAITSAYDGINYAKQLTLQQAVGAFLYTEKNLTFSSELEMFLKIERHF